MDDILIHFIRVIACALFAIFIYRVLSSGINLLCCLFSKSFRPGMLVVIKPEFKQTYNYLVPPYDVLKVLFVGPLEYHVSTKYRDDIHCSLSKDLIVVRGGAGNPVVLPKSILKPYNVTGADK